VALMIFRDAGLIPRYRYLTPRPKIRPKIIAEEISSGIIISRPRYIMERNESIITRKSGHSNKTRNK
jgi:hypothetical protein